jgi:hypothetical protein
LPARGLIHCLYAGLVVVGAIFVYGYGVSVGDATRTEAMTLLYWDSVTYSVLQAGWDPLTLGRWLSLSASSLFLAAMLARLRRRLGPWGMSASVVGIATSPILVRLLTSASGEGVLVGVMSCVLAPILLGVIGRWPARGEWMGVGGAALLMVMGLSGFAEMLMGRGRLIDRVESIGWVSPGLGVVSVLAGFTSVTASVLVGGWVASWARGELVGMSSRRAGHWATILVFRVMVMALVLAIGRVVIVPFFMERCHILVACAWGGLVLTLAQARLWHREAHFAPLLLLAVAAKVVWVHALVTERDLASGSAVLARAIARTLPEDARVESELMNDAVFEYHLRSALAGRGVGEGSFWKVRPADASSGGMGVAFRAPGGSWVAVCEETVGAVHRSAMNEKRRQ